MQSVLIFIIGLFFGSLTAYFARQRGRNPAPWFLVGFFFGLLGFLVLFIFPSLATPQKLEDPSVLTEDKPALSMDFDSRDWFYLTKEREQVGPVKFEELRKLWNRNVLNPQTYVWCDALQDWKRIVELNLFNLKRAVKNDL